MKEDFTIDNGGCHITKKAVNRNSQHMLPVVDWLSDIPSTGHETDLVEVQFKNTRKGYFHNSEHLPLEKGMAVVVESNPGTDLGEVSLVGELVPLQMRKYHINTDRYEIRNVLRLATSNDLDTAEIAHSKEQETMIKARQLAKSLGLEMKIGDVEYQGDKIKAIFYYIADGRVDFRELIKVFAEQFRIKIEMKQIGARQEAGRIGGLGSCGRELCCASWISSFTSVTTNAARTQDLSLNPQKLAGQCGKLKCCLVYELDSYIDARKSIPRLHEPLHAMDGDYYHISTDVLARVMSFSTVPDAPMGNIKLTVSKVREILNINRAGKKVDTIVGEVGVAEPEITFASGSEEDSITRFDRSKRKKNRSKRQREGKDVKKPAKEMPSTTTETQAEKEASTDRGERRGQGGRNRSNNHRGHHNGRHANREQAPKKNEKSTSDGE